MMMSLPVFLKFVEIKTKLASLFPFMIGTLFVYYHYGTIKPLNTIIFFCSMFIFDLTCTAINNYMDYKKAFCETYRHERNIIGKMNIPEWQIKSTIFTLLIIAIATGIWLVTRTDLVVLLIGMSCFAIGIFYTFGPIPLSRMPLGELFSGGAMGFGIVFLAVYVNAFDQGIAQFIWEGSVIHFQANLLLILEILIVSLPCAFTISNIMLANNTCDLEEDIANQRYTLPYYIGKRKAVFLFNALYVASFMAIVAAVALRLMPPLMLLTLIVAVPVYKHVRKFNLKQIKSETFVVSLQNLVLVNSSL